jgi:hypothetical protein
VGADGADGADGDGADGTEGDVGGDGVDVGVVGASADNQRLQVPIVRYTEPLLCGGGMPRHLRAVARRACAMGRRHSYVRNWSCARVRPTPGP